LHGVQGGPRSNLGAPTSLKPSPSQRSVSAPVSTLLRAYASEWLPRSSRIRGSNARDVVTRPATCISRSGAAPANLPADVARAPCRSTTNLRIGRLVRSATAPVKFTALPALSVAETAGCLCAESKGADASIHPPARQAHPPAPEASAPPLAARTPRPGALGSPGL